MTFISFAIMEGHMYTALRLQGTFVVNGLRTHSNSVVYGAIYLLRDDDFHIRTIDGMYLCSKSALGRNHNKDRMHREKVIVYPIRFKSLEDLESLKYTELGGVEVDAYLGNKAHSIINKRISTKKHVNYRIMDGVDKVPFLEQLKEVLNE